MDFDSNEPQPGRLHEEHYDPFQKSSPGMLSISLVLAVLSIMLCWMIYLAVPLASIAIILALLSRGGTDKIARHVRRVLITAALGMVLSVGITGYAFYEVYTHPEMKAQLDQIVEYYLRQYYGNSYESSFGDNTLDTEDHAKETEEPSEEKSVTAPERQILPWENTHPENLSAEGGTIV